jgi:hypothetical protein
MKYVTVGVALFLILLMSGVARADGPDLGPWTLSQWKVIGLAYEYADHYGLTDADRDLFLGVLYRESHYGYDKTGDCYWRADGSEYCLSIGVAMFHEAGVWASTPCARLGLQARWDDDASVNCMAWAWNRGMKSHWRPWEQPASNWPRVLPSDPRGWLWGQVHYPGRG